MSLVQNKLFLSGNYIIAEKNNGVDPIQRTEYAISHTVYTRFINGQFPGGVDQFQVIEGGISPKANGRLVIPVSEVDPDLGVWFDETGLIRFTEETLTTFLRGNTGFNPASGGSGANTWNVATVAFIDPVNGDDDAAIIGDGNKPFKFITNAILAGAEKIILLPGDYWENLFVTADNINIFAFAGVKFIAGGIRVIGADVNNFDFSGFAVFSGSSTALRAQNTDATINFECDYIDDNRIVCWTEGNAYSPKIRFECNWILCNAYNGGGYCVRLVGGSEIYLNVKHYFHAQHSPYHVRNGTTGKLIVNCPETKIVPNYTSNYGNAAKSVVWCDAASAYIEINGDLINEHNVYVFGRGCIEINNWTGAPTTLIVNGDLKGNENMCIFSQYRSAFGNIIINGDLETNRNPVFDELTGWGAPANQHWTFNNSTIQAEFQFIVGRGKTYYFKNISMLVREDGTGTPGAGKLFLGLEPGSPASLSYLYFFNCVMQSKDTTLDTFNFSANFNVGTINTISNLPIGTGVVDAWGGFASIASLEVPQNT